MAVVPLLLDVQAAVRTEHAPTTMHTVVSSHHHTQINPYSSTHAHTVAHSHTQSHTVTHSCTHTDTHTHTQRGREARAHGHTDTHTRSLARTDTRTHTHTHTLTHSLTHSLTRTLTHSHTPILVPAAQRLDWLRGTTQQAARHRGPHRALAIDDSGCKRLGKADPPGLRAAHPQRQTAWAQWQEDRQLSRQATTERGRLRKITVPCARRMARTCF
jgi:hypothetical protein